MPEKELVVVGGPNGAGKTTFALEYAQLRGWMYLSADAIAAELAPSDPASQQIAAGRRFLEFVTDAITKDESFIVESTLSGVTFLRQIEAAKHSGFLVSIVYLFLDSPESCVARVNARVLHGGHFVPEEDVRRRYHRSLSNFWHKYRLLADNWVLLYNSSTGLIDVALSNDDDTRVADSELFDNFAKMVGTSDD